MNEAKNGVPSSLRHPKDHFSIGLRYDLRWRGGIFGISVLNPGDFTVKAPVDRNASGNDSQSSSCPRS